MTKEIDEDLMKKVKTNEIELMKNSIPLHFVKVDEKISSTVYEIPIEYKLKLSNSNKININDQNIIYQKNYKLKTINNDNNIRIQMKKNRLFPSKPFSLTEMGYKYYNQQLSPLQPNEKLATHFDFFRKSKSPQTHASNTSTSMNSTFNYFNKRNNNIDIHDARGSFLTPSNSMKIIKGFGEIHSPFYKNRLSNYSVNNAKNIIKNKQNKSNNSSRIKHRIINVYRSNDYLNDNKNNCNNIINKKNNIGIDGETRTINLNKKRNIFLDLDDDYYNSNNYNCNNYNHNNYNIFSLNNHNIVRSPKMRLPRVIENQRVLQTEYNFYNGKQSENSQRNIGRKNICDKKVEEIQVLENEDSNEKESIKISPRRDFGDNYRYYERKEVKIPKKDGKINHIRRSPVHVYGFQNYIMKDNKKIYLKTPPIRGKLIRMYRNNSNINCNICKINEIKNKNKQILSSSSNFRENNILLPVKFKRI